MKVYVKFESYEPRHKADMEKIMAYLRDHGQLCINMNTVERLYYDFSDEKASASWLTPDDDTLEALADWLADIDL